ncbi:MAG: hypothetical protein CMF31_06295 [Kordiimonas sp.]|nr:hypothetical protein [Kordiimonas sp.]|tara:strand:- start:2369 stop:3724 length:1356 start_codon:yes stop_codon:yes gene_type:complete
MIRLFFYSLIGLAIAVGAVWIAEKGGSLTFSWQSWEIHMSVGVMLALLLITIIALALIRRVFSFLLHPPALRSEKRIENRRHKGHTALDQGFSALAAGNPTLALQQARKAQRLLPGETPALLLEAQANRQLPADKQNLKRQDSLYLKLADKTDTKLLGLRGQVEAAIAAQEWHNALHLAKQAVEADAKSPWACQALLNIQIRLEDWQDALNTLKSATKLHILPGDKLIRMRSVLNYCLAREESLSGHKAAAIKRVELALKESPALLPAVMLAVELKAGNTAALRKIIETAWRHQPHPHLADAYLELQPMETATEQLRHGEKLTRSNADHVDSHHLLARLNLDAQHWPDARQHLDRILSTQRATTQTYELLAELEELQKNDQTSADILRQKGKDAPAPAQWTCQHCAETAPGWAAPHCPHCGSFDSLQWTTAAHHHTKERALPHNDGLLLPS